MTSWSPDDIDEAYRLRALIEGYAAGLAARRADAAVVVRLRNLQERYERALAEGSASGKSSASADGTAPPGGAASAGTSLAASARCNDDFHAAVLDASGSARLPALVALVTSAPLVRQVLGGYDEDDRRRSILQHRDIITAIDNGDEELATSAMSSHILAARYSAVRRAAEGR